jgi:tetratricopeptide (TPR) repeat protein
VTRRPATVLLTLLAGASLLGGCVYYNGMYNTNRLAKSARKAERDGRTFEANNLWGQVITRAESLVVRHPRSKYANEANVLRGLALARLDQCPAAVGPLGRLTLLDRAGDLMEEAALALGRCQLELGDADVADLAFVRVIGSTDPTRRREARFQHARALRMTGHYEEALAVLQETPDPRGRNDLLLSLAGAGRTGEALAMADSLLASGDTAFAWDSVVAALGRQDPRAATTLVDRLQNDRRANDDLRALRLYEDALRLAAVDTARAVARLNEATQVPGKHESGERARLRLLRRALGNARTLDDLPPIGDSLAALGRRSSGAAFEAAGLAGAVAQVRLIPDSSGPSVPLGDLRLFLGAELARDSLRAPALAASLFQRLADDWPGSPYAPKALLAAAQLDPAGADAARARLDSLYAGSPYLAVVRGGDAPDYRMLEDSLAAFAATQVVAGARRQPPGLRGRPAGDVAPQPGQQRPRQGPPGEDVPKRRRLPQP